MIQAMKDNRLYLFPWREWLRYRLPIKAAAIIIVILAAWPSMAWAEGDGYTLPYFERFYNLDQYSLNSNSNTKTEYKGWTIYGCALAKTGVNSSDSSLVIHNYATTPTITTNSNYVKFSFWYSASNASNPTSFSVTVNGGVFDNNENTKEFNSSTKAFAQTEQNIICDGNRTLSITFTLKSSNSFFRIDDVKLVSSTATSISLFESTDNSSTLSANNGHIRDVTLTRSLQPNIWNTMCLPFDVTKEELAALGTVDKVCTFTSVEEGYVMTFSDTESVAAGTPFLLRLTSVNDTKTFSDRVIKNTAPTGVSKTYNEKTFTFQGIYSRTDLLTDGTNVFLGTDGKLYKPSDSDHATINGMRAYFVVPSGTVGSVRIDGQDTEGIFMITADDDVMQPWYSLDGQRQNAPQQKGIYIHDGKKIVVK